MCGTCQTAAAIQLHAHASPSLLSGGVIPARWTHPAIASSGPQVPVGGEVPVVEFEKVSLAFDDNVVLREVSFSVQIGHMAMLLGASGSGLSSAPPR